LISDIHTPRTCGQWGYVKPTGMQESEDSDWL
jgi:hypothetical protein